MRTYNVSKFWEHLVTGQWLRVLEQDRTAGTITVREQWPDGREWYVTLQIIKIEQIHSA